MILEFHVRWQALDVDRYFRLAEIVTRALRCADDDGMSQTSYRKCRKTENAGNARLRRTIFAAVAKSS